MKLYFDRDIMKLVADNGAIIENLEVARIDQRWDSDRLGSRGLLMIDLIVTTTEDFMGTPPFAQRSI